MDFTAIDFETASQRRDSACQLAAVVVRDGQIVDSASWMIRPDPMHFTSSNIRIHGITPDQVRDEPTFAGHWPEIAARLGEDCLVAHNASFDIGVLLACLRRHRLPAPDLNFACTRAVSRRAWPGRRGYGLKPLATWLGIRFRHHDALEDSIACAKLLLAAGIATGAKTVESLESRLRLTRGTAGDWGYCGPSAGRRRASPSGAAPRRGRSAASETPRNLPRGNTAAMNSYAQSAQASGGRHDEDPRPDGPADPPAMPLGELQRLIVRGEFLRPLAGRTVVFTGTFRSFSRDFAESLASRLGASCQSSVTSNTDVVVVGNPDPRTRAAGRSRSVKEDRARELQAAGCPIRLLDEVAFLRSLAESPTPTPASPSSPPS